MPAAALSQTFLSAMSGVKGWLDLSVGFKKDLSQALLAMAPQCGITCKDLLALLSSSHEYAASRQECRTTAEKHHLLERGDLILLYLSTFYAMR
jgi:hypothetical protein